MKSSRSDLLHCLFPFLLALAAAGACSPGNGDETVAGIGPGRGGRGGSGTGGSAATGGGAANGGDGGSGVQGGSGGGSGGINTDSGIITPGDGGLDEMNACAADTHEGVRKPLDLYMMIDSTGSMLDQVGTTTKWAAVTGAIKGFVQDPTSADLGVGMQYFGLPADPASCPSKCTDCTCWMNQCGCTSCSTINGVSKCTGGATSCDQAAYASPAIPIDRCSNVASQIVSSLDAHTPVGGTPTSAALQGAVNYATDWAKNHQDHTVIVVLATDGEPTLCDTNIPNIATIASNACGATPPIKTFVIGVGNLGTNLDAIASAGCTGNAFIIDTAGDVMKQFRHALDSIRAQAAPCEYAIPLPESGTPNLDLVNVQITPSNGDPAYVVPYAKSLGNCDPVRGGWYYDVDPPASHKILLCPATCDRLKADLYAKVNVLLGCEQVVY